MPQMTARRGDASPQGFQKPRLAAFETAARPRRNTIARTPTAVNARPSKECCTFHHLPPNGRAFSGEPSERSERPERMRGRRVRCTAMLGSRPVQTGYMVYRLDRVHG